MRARKSRFCLKAPNKQISMYKSREKYPEPQKNEGHQNNESYARVLRERDFEKRLKETPTILFCFYFLPLPFFFTFFLATIYHPIFYQSSSSSSHSSSHSSSSSSSSHSSSSTILFTSGFSINGTTHSGVFMLFLPKILRENPHLRKRRLESSPLSAYEAFMLIFGSYRPRYVEKG
jgi:hypothetical protein